MEADQSSIKLQGLQTAFQQATPVRPRTSLRASLVHRLRDALAWLGLSATRAVLLLGFTALAFGMLVRSGLHAFDCAVMTLRLSCNAYLVLCKNAMSSYRSSSASPYFTVGLVLWSLHMIYSSYLAYYLPDLPAAWQQLFHTGLINILLLVSTMMDYTLTGDRLPRHVIGALSMIHGTNIAVTLLNKCGTAQRGCVSATSSTVLPLLATAVLPKLWWHKRRQHSSVPANAVTSTGCQQQLATHPASCLGRAPSTPPSRIMLDSAGEMHSTNAKAGLELPPVVQAPALLTLSDPQPPGTNPTTTAPLHATLPNTACPVKSRATDTLFGLLGHTAPPVASQATHPTMWQLAAGLDQQQLQVRRSDSSRSAGQPVNPAAVMNLVHAHRQPQYVSRLGRKSKLCLKVRTDRQMADLPADMGDHMQRALDEIGGPRLHIMDVAVRPGCILMSLDLLQKQQQRLSSDSTQPATMLTSLMGAGFPASSAVGTDAAMLESVAAALTPLLEPLLEVQQHNNTRLGLPSNVGPVKPVTLTDNEYLRIQVGHTVASVIWSHESGGWLLAPLLHPAAAVMAVGDSAGMGVISNKAKLGMAATVKTSMTSDGGISVQALLLLLGVGDENVVIHGWQPPAPGEHSAWPELVPYMMPSSTSSCSSSLTASSMTTTSTVGGPGHPVRVIVRAGGGYLSTAVKAMPLQVAGPIHHDVPTTLQVSFTVPQLVAARHHASSPASSLQPGIHIELWHGDVLLSSVPLLALGPGQSTRPDDTTTLQNLPLVSNTGATAADSRSQAVHEPVWWGVDHITTAAAVKELHELATDIVSGQWMDLQMSEAELLQSHNSLIEFEKDLQIWLQLVQRCMQFSRLCVSPNSSKDPLMAGWVHEPCLDESQAEQLSRDLIGFAEASGLHAVQQMIALQRGALKAGKAAAAAQFTQLPTFINAVRHAALGVACQHCDALHRMTVEHVVQSLRHTYSCFMLVAVLAACCVFVNHPVRRLVPAAAFLPCMLHAAAVLSWPVSHSRPAAHSSSNSNNNLSTAALRPAGMAAQWLPLLSMVLRTVAQMVLLAAVGKSAWPRASIGPWLAVQACVSIAEQVQLSLVLSPVLVMLSAALLDIPSMAWLLSHGSATFSVGTYALIASLLIVIPRLLLMAQWYCMTFKEPTSRPSNTTAASSSHGHHDDMTSSQLPNGKATGLMNGTKLD